MVLPYRSPFAFAPAPTARDALDQLSNRELTVSRSLGAALNDLVDAARDAEREMNAALAQLIAAGRDTRPLEAARDRLRQALHLQPLGDDSAIVAVNAGGQGDTVRALQEAFA